MSRKKYIAHPYQKLITQQHLSLPRCVTFAGLGTGKTSSTLTSLDAMYLAGESSPTLVLAPLRVCQSVWPGEVEKWDHLTSLSVTPIVGTADERIRALRHDTPIYTCNYDNIPWLVEHFGSQWPFKIVVADELTRLKSFRLRQGGVRAQALSKVMHTKVKRFIGLTGTPAPNGLMDLWGQVWMLDRGQRLGRTFTAFKDRWFCRTEDGFGYQLRSSSCEQEIYGLLKDVCLTIDAKDYFDLKEPIVRNVEFELPPKARAIYDKMKKELVAQIDSHQITAANAAVKTQKLLQLASGYVYHDPSIDGDDEPGSRKFHVIHDMKLQALDSIVSETNGVPLLVAYNFRSELESILKAFPKAEVFGKDPTTEARWNAGKIPMLLGHPASIGHGLSLQDGGNIMVFFGHNWSLENRLQIIERIGPMRQLQSGHDRNVWIYNIVASRTADQIVIDRVSDKSLVQESLLSALKRY